MVSSKYPSRKTSPNASARPAIEASSIDRQVRGVRGARDLGVLDEADVVATAAGVYPQFLLAGQQALVDLPVALRVAFEHRVADVLASERHRRALLLFERDGQPLFFSGRSLVVVSDGVDGLGQFLVQLARGVLDARVDLDDLRMLVAVAL
jgi:hypothetical protein